MANPHLQNLLNKEVSRKESLTLARFGAASLFGFWGIIKLLTGHSPSSSYKHVSVGYGDSDYGGKNKTTATVSKVT